MCVESSKEMPEAKRRGEAAQRDTEGARARAKETLSPFEFQSKLQVDFLTKR